jgi:hypothetical protein
MFHIRQLKLWKQRLPCRLKHGEKERYMIFHVDGNSFYAACERVFRPDLYSSPIAVLSNNDGIIIALNAECKALGFKRGDVFFENKRRLEKANVAIFSSNYTLYADMSARMNLIYNRFAPEVEVYSIDESFLFFPDWKATEYAEIGHELKETVTRETGIPVAVGIAPNKTLAKMCNNLAKTGIKTASVPFLSQDECKHSSTKAVETAASRGEPRIVDTMPLCGSVEYTMPPKASRFLGFGDRGMGSRKRC